MQVVTILGSNSGNKRQLITEAIRILSSTEQWVMASSFYETAPWGFECDENFLNQVVVFQTRLSAFDFLQRCLETEKTLRTDQTCRRTPLFFPSDRYRPVILWFCHSEYAGFNTSSSPYAGTQFCTDSSGRNLTGFCPSGISENNRHLTTGMSG